MPDLTGKTVLITGATDGIGRLTAERLAAADATLLIHGRDQGRIDTAIAEITEATGNAKIQGYRADYAKLEEVRGLAVAVTTDQPSLDVLINNAGIGSGGKTAKRRVSPDGHELVFQVNFLAPFLLNHLLLPAMAEGGRIVNVASAGQMPLDFDNLMLEHGFEGHRAYRQSKLALIMFTIDFAEQAKARGVTVNAMHPGSLLNTKMVREGFGYHWGEPEEGAEAEMYLATASELADVTGCYYDQTEPAEPLPQAADPEARARLWALAAELTGVGG